MSDSHHVYLAFGTNLGDRMRNLREALRRLPPAVTVQETSPVYESAAAYVVDQPAFLNMVLRAVTDLKPYELLAYVKHIEVEMGRKAGVRYGPRPIDIDILFYDDLVLKDTSLTIPHAALHERAFVLRPLADIDPDLVHPVLGRSVQRLLAEGPAQGPILRQIAESLQS